MWPTLRMSSFLKGRRIRMKVVREKEGRGVPERRDELNIVRYFGSGGSGADFVGVLGMFGSSQVEYDDLGAGVAYAIQDLEKVIYLLERRVCGNDLGGMQVRTRRMASEDGRVYRCCFSKFRGQ